MAYSYHHAEAFLLMGCPFLFRGGFYFGKVRAVAGDDFIKNFDQSPAMISSLRI